MMAYPHRATLPKLLILACQTPLRVPFQFIRFFNSIAQSTNPLLAAPTLVAKTSSVRLFLAKLSKGALPVQ